MDKNLALETLKSFVKHPTDITIKDAILALHPELAESEDERIRKHIIDIIKDNAKSKCIPCDAEIAYLEKQKEQKSTEWSEEDDKIKRNLMSLLSSMRGDRITVETYQKYYPWLRDLPKRFNLQSHWKPSEEQIYSLGTVVKGAGENSVGSVAYNLKELYNDLKKL